MKNIIKAPDILIPKDRDLYKWAVVACDQFNAQPDYWESLEKLTEGAPSALNLIFPEIYLEDNPEARIKNINRVMKEYLDNGIFDTVENSFILIERDTYKSKGRIGLVMAVDLDAYDYRPFSKAYIKATEATIEDRIPPRLKIRGNADLELPHIILLLDDRDATVLEPLYANRDKLEVVYDSDLNMDGGHIKGYRVTDTEPVIDAIYRLLDKDLLIEKYGFETDFLFAAGDGNHSLATAKAHWDKIKVNLTEEERENHPAKYALVEVENLHDKTLTFEPIHRVVFNGGQKFIDSLNKSVSGGRKVEVIYGGKIQTVSVSDGSADAINDIQQFIDGYIKENPEAAVEYVHGRNYLEEVCAKRGAVGIVMPCCEKSELFDYVLKNGKLPRKAFSMGDAEEKRYYVEAHKITL